MLTFRHRLIMVLIAGWAIVFIACGKEEKKAETTEVVRPVKLMTVGSTQDESRRSFSGRVRASRRVDLAFQVSGPLVDLSVEEGKAVKKGNVVARIDPRDFEAQVKNAEGRLANAQAQLKAMRQARPEDIRRLEANLQKAEAAAKLGQAEYERIERIKQADPGAVSQGMIDRAVERKARAEAELLTAQEDLRIGKLGARPEDIQAKEAEIKSLTAELDAAKHQLSYTYLRAPFDGVISRRYVNNFQEIRAKEPIVGLDDISSVEILVDVPELVMATIREGKGRAVAEFAAAPGKQYPLKLKEIATRADPKTQTYQVVLQMLQPGDIRVLPGMTATVTGTAGAKKTSQAMLVVPAVAVTADASGNPRVWIVDKETMKVQPRAVKTGNLTGTDSIEIVEGLKPGETIAISGVSRLREGMQVSDLSKMEGFKR